MDFEVAPGTIVGGDFRLLRPLASGGMGAVYVAEQISTARHRALKLMRRDLAGAPGAAERFVLEARVAARIGSDHVVEVVAAGIDPALRAPWLAMELLEGWSLDALVRQRGRLGVPEAAEILRQLGAGLAAAHAAGVVHRDLKPENVFVSLSRDASRGVRVKILDFGIAKVLAEAAAGGGATSAVGTPRWMAPEQTDAQSVVSPATDVWAYGLVAYHALTGRCFWRAGAGGPGANVAQLLREVLADPIPPASQRAAEQGAAGVLPPGFDVWLGRCVARDPRDRFPDAAAAVAALGPVLGLGHVDVALLAAPPSGPDAAAAAARSVSPTAPTMALTPPPTPAARRPGRGGVVAGAIVGVSVGLLAVGVGVAHLAGAGIPGATASAAPSASTLPEAPPASSVAVPIAPDPAAVDRLDGEWLIAAASKPGGGSYQGKVTVASLGAAKIVTWILQGQVVQGLGQVTGDRLDVAFGPAPFALGVYEAKSGVLEGTLLDGGAPGMPLTERLTGSPSLEGPFRIAHASAGYTGQVTITREGDRLRLVRATSASSPVGVGLRQGDRIVAAYSTTGYAGVVTYTIAPDGRSMRGVWADLTSTRTGTEELKRP